MVCMSTPTLGRIGYSLAVLIAISPILTIFAIIMRFLPIYEWYYVMFFGSMILFALIGCGMTGYNSGPLWTYHGDPRAVDRPDVEQLIGVEK